MARTPPIPRFVLPGALPDGIKLNFFQTAGNNIEFTLSVNPISGDRIMFRSDMKGKEIHGNIDGFAPENLTDQVSSMFKNHDTMHVDLINLARPKVQARIKNLLDRL
jgi:hypothetical protein